MCRNKTLCPRLPKFKDTRKIKQTPVFNGWTDEREPRSPLADLFAQLTPIFQNLKRKRGALTFPPRPPHPELDQPPETCSLPRLVLRSSSEENAVFARDWLLPELSDFNCSKRELRPVVGSELTDLAATIRLPVNSGSKYQARAPVLVENERHFDRIMKEAGDGLVAVDFFATWCSPCKIIGPLFRMLALKTPTMRFVKVDIDVCDKLTKSLHVHSIPTIKVFRGGGLTSAYNNVGTIEGGDHFIVNFMTLMAQVSNKDEAAFLATQVDRTRVAKGGYAEASKMGCDLAALQGLASSPLASLGNFVQEETKQEALVDSELLFNIENHESAKSAVARSMMQRIKTDVKAWASKANSSSKSKVADLYDSTVNAFFDGDAAAEAKIRASLATLQRLLSELRTLRDVDARAVQDAIPLLEGSANFVGIEDVPKVELKEGSTAPLPTEQDLQRISKLKYLLRRQSGQESTMWLTFLFGALLSSKASIDMKRLNPYLADSSIQVILDLVTLTILRTNRVGHANRCIAASLNLVSMIEKVLELPQAERQLRKQALMPSVIQSGEALARQLVTRRWFVHDQSLNYDPRYLVFEFTWNIMLRKKQVEIVDNFMATLRENKSKVKQMIMGAGKTTVVAPLLALMLADGSSLILSVVPRALVEMSRKLMRETFATIMQKRIYTLKYDRSTIVQPAMCRSLQNAVRNRGIVVCTPTTIKSVMLSYIEVLQGLTDCKKNSLAARLKELSVQAVELSKMLRLFREGVMLLDEVDLILHPLKSELNFPIGEKFDLDVSEQGERWGLPIHLMDAMFFTRTGKITTFEQRGTAVDILRRLANAVEEGFRRRALQRLPHITLLNPAFYHQCIKPVMAEWAYLWLQKQHLHGISRQEAMQYLLEGATARSAATTKIQIIDLAINKINIESGQRPSEPEPTHAHTDAMAMDPVKQRPRTSSQVSEADSIRLKAELEQLTEAKTVSQQQQQLIHTVCDLDTQLDRTLQESGAAIAHIQKRIAGINKRIEEMEFPQDDSLDNAVVVWLSQAFNANVTVGASGLVNPVHSACTMLEDSGLTVKRCDVLEEAVDRVRDLQQSGRLRCVIAGGDGVVGCSIGCNDDHSSLNCLVCRKPWGHHNGHNCPKDDRQGSFPTSVTTKTNQLDYLGFMKELTSTDTAFARKFSAVPKARTAMFNAGAVMTEPERLSFWRLGVIIPEDTKDLMTWTNMLPAWPKVENKEEEEDEPVPAAADAGDEDMPTAPTLTRQVSVGSLRLQKLRKQLEILEKQKLALLDVEDTKRKSLRAIIADKHRLLIESIDNRVNTLQKAVVRATALGNTGFKAIAEQRTAIGPSSGRDAALALAWLALNDKQSAIHDKQPELSEVSLVSPKSGRAPPPPPPRSSPPPPPPSLVDQKLLASCVRKLQDEILYLGQTALAAKVVAFVSLVHKKLLNLSHDWLKCFLPHCLSKVNRVSFGLLNDSEAKEALILDPHVPRSRLKLAVPFVGKDVPSQSSEFAHPEVIIGLTVLAYRYSGLRREEDFADIIDSMTTEFSHEIGPARDRASSRRHETWVLEAGGTIRGIKQPLKGTIPLEQSQHIVLSASADDDSRVDSKLAENYQSLLTHVSSSSQTTLPSSSQPAASDATAQTSEPMDDFPSTAAAPSAEIDDPTAREVVQLKYLQKSNDEQMIKLYQLWMKEPNVIHHYLCKTIFPGHMRHQMFKISASGQSVGGDMLVGRRVGFSGTPSDLLPKELGKCDYETGDDGKMLTTVLDTSVMDSENLPGNWDVEFLLQRVANAEKPRFHSLIDTGALITGYTNEQVARELLKRGLSWCDGVVFLDDQDKQQVLVRATDRVVNADQCGISLERRFAFYDQIHTTGMDISHVVNARAVITLGKDMVFRDYVQGAFRMRGIGAGQTITVYIIPEVAELIQRELTAALVPGTVVNPLAGTPRGTLVDIAAWLVINSMRSEQVQWNMLCIQNVANIYRKNAFQTIYESTAYFTGENKENTAKYDPNKSLALFSEAIDFSLEAAVPDPVPFGDKLRVMLEENSAFIATAEQHEVGHSVLVEVGEHALLDESPQRLETEQEREQEQEQQKEVRARRDQQVEVEKFVDREYSRNEEAPRPWHISMLAKYATAQKADELDLHPFYPLHEFRLRHQEPLKFPGCLYVSRNYFNPQWAGLRRVKNVVMVLEWAPNSSNVRLLTPEECTAAVGQLTPIQEQGLAKAYQLLSFHGHQGGANDDLGITKLDLYNAVNAATDSKLTEPQMDEIISKFGKNNRLSLAEFRHLLSSGHLRREEKDRFWVAVSLAEAETLRRLMHIRLSKPLVDGAKVEAALRYSPTCSPNAPLAGDSGDIFDTSLGWRGGTKAYPYHEAVAHNCFRFFDSEMHFTDPGLNVGVRALQACTPNERERFFTTTIGCRRRMERKWQETPVAKILTVPDEWAALKYRAFAVFMREAIAAKQLTLWEAFTVFDADNNGLLSPAEFYGALRWLNVPDCTPEDVVDFITAADLNHDNSIDYKEYIDAIRDPDEVKEGEEDENSARTTLPPKIEPYGGEELRELMIKRKREEMMRARDETLRRQAYQQTLDMKLFEEEFKASQSRKGGANPRLYPGSLPPNSLVNVVEFRFTQNDFPLRLVATGKHKLQLMNPPPRESNKAALQCPRDHELSRIRRRYNICNMCSRQDTQYRCGPCDYDICQFCFEAKTAQLNKQREGHNDPTSYLSCSDGCSFTVQVPAQAKSVIQNHVEYARFTITMELRIDKLPLNQQIMALLRFSPSEMSRSRRRNIASVYLDSNGCVSCSAEGADDDDNTNMQPTEQKSVECKSGPSVRVREWCVVTVAVDAVAGHVETYINGELSSRQTGREEDLTLKHKLVVFGGGKRGESKGGCVRRIFLHDRPLSAEEVHSVADLCLTDIRGRPSILWLDLLAIKKKKGKEEKVVAPGDDLLQVTLMELARGYAPAEGTRLVLPDSSDPTAFEIRKFQKLEEAVSTLQYLLTKSLRPVKCVCVIPDRVKMAITDELDNSGEEAVQAAMAAVEEMQTATSLPVSFIVYNTVKEVEPADMNEDGEDKNGIPTDTEGGGDKVVESNTSADDIGKPDATNGETTESKEENDADNDANMPDVSAEDPADMDVTVGSTDDVNDKEEDENEGDEQGDEQGDGQQDGKEVMEEKVEEPAKVPPKTVRTWDELAEAAKAAEPVKSDLSSLAKALAKDEMEEADGENRNSSDDEY